MDEEALARRAALAGAEVSSLEGGVRGQFHVGIFKDDHGPIPPELEDSCFAGRAASDLLAGGDRTDKAHAIDTGVTDESGADNRPGAGRKLKTPLGKPASTRAAASWPEHAAVVGAGTQTTVFPAASAGATSSAIMVYGQFHGVTTPTTPRGTRIVSALRSAETDGISSPCTRTAS